MWKTVAIFVVSNMRFQMNVRILKIPPVFDYPKLFSKGNMVFDYQNEFDDPQVSDGPKVISNESMDFNDPRDFDDH